MILSRTPSLCEVSPGPRLPIMNSPLRSAYPVVIAHRGASHQAPENTMPAFTAGWAQGVSWTETDSQPSADGFPVLIHDDDVDRTTDGCGLVRNLSLTDLAALDAGAWKGRQFVGTRIPRLAELLAALPAHQHLLLEIKGSHDAQQLRALLAQVQAAPADSRVFLQSFERDVLEILAELAPQRPRGLLSEIADDDPVATARRYGACSYNPDFALVAGCPEMVAALHDADISVAVWTCDEVSQWELLTSLGVDAIITNTPGACLAWQRR